MTRPDSEYWKTPFTERRRRFSNEQIADIQNKVELYDKKRFEYGGRFQLAANYIGIPKGTRCTIIKTWPQTRALWDIWSKDGYGSTKRETSMSYDLDIRLEPL
jgi:hypothetical protein